MSLLGFWEIKENMTFQNFDFAKSFSSKNGPKQDEKIKGKNSRAEKKKAEFFLV